jgi:hypothetical protein
MDTFEESNILATDAETTLLQRMFSEKYNNSLATDSRRFPNCPTNLLQQTVTGQGKKPSLQL